MTVKEESVAAVKGAKLWTAHQSSGQGLGVGLVLCHGGPGLWDYLGPVADGVDDMVTVYRYDQRGCGRSSGESPFDLTTYVEDLDALRQHWRLPEWIVGGHSWGASLALAYSLAHPEHVKGLIYISGTGVNPAWHAEYHANRSTRLTPEEQRRLANLRTRMATAQGADLAALSREYCTLSWSADFADMARGRELAESLFVGDLQPNYEVNRALGADENRLSEDESVVEKLTVLQAPVLIMHGDSDPRPLRFIQELADILPNSQLVILPATGHFPWLEQPHHFIGALRRFIEQCLR